MSSVSDDLGKNVARLSSLLKTILTRIPLADDDEQLVDLIAPPIQECVKVAESLNIEYPLKLTFSEDDDFEYVKLEYFPDPLVGMNSPLSRKGVLILKFEIFGASKRFYFSALDKILNKTCKVWIDFLSRPEAYEERLQNLRPDEAETSKQRPKNRGGRPVDQNQQRRDKLIYEARKQENPTPYEYLEEKFGISGRDARLAYQREQKKQKRRNQD